MQAHLNLCLNVLSAYERSSGVQSLDNMPFLYLVDNLELSLHTRLRNLWHIQMQHMPIGDDQRMLGDIPSVPLRCAASDRLTGLQRPSSILIRYA